MKENNYKKNFIIAIICNILGLFILGYIFSGISYNLFDKNYKNSLDNHKKRRQSLWGKVVSTFLICMSISYHGQSRANPLDERMAISCIVGGIFAIIFYFKLNSKEKKIPLQKVKKENSKSDLALKSQDKQNNKNIFVGKSAKKNISKKHINTNLILYLFLIIVVSCIIFVPLFTRKDLSNNKYRARHILVSSETEANVIIYKLNHEYDFCKLAEEYSQDNSNSSECGDLGYFSEGDMVIEFENAVKELDYNEFTSKPIKTEYGYHIIMRIK